MSTPLALAAVATLAAAASLRRGRGSRAADAWLDLEYMADRGGDLHEHYPQTAAGQMQLGSGEQVFWAGRGYRKIGYVGPTDGRMVSIEARYAEPIDGNIFYPEKLSALVGAVRDGDQPVVDSGYADLMLLSGQDVRESQEYDDERPWDSDDIGALYADVRDGNHRTMAALLAGSDFTWVRMSDSTRQELLRPSPARKRASDKLYAAIRRAQRAHGAPLIQRPRRKRAHPDLARATKQHDRLKTRERELYQELLREFEDLGDGFAWTLEQRLERPQLFLRQRLGRARDEGDDTLLDRYFDHPLKTQLDRVYEQKRKASDRLWELRKASGLDPRTGEPQ